MPVISSLIVSAGLALGMVKLKRRKRPSLSQALTIKTRKVSRQLDRSSLPAWLTSASEQPNFPAIDVRKEEIRLVEQHINRSLAVAGGTLIMLVAGAGGITWLGAGAWLGMAVIAANDIQAVYRNLREHGKIGGTAVDAITLLAIPFVGYAIPYMIYRVLLFSSQKILLKTRDKSRKELINIMGELPRTVWMKRGELEIEVPFTGMEAGDLIVVHAGGIVPADGRIVEGLATVDQHRLTGESQPAEKGIGDSVFAATLVLSGRLCIHVEKAGRETVAAQIGQVLNRTADYRSPLESRGEILTDRATVPMMALSAISLPFVGPVSALAMFSATPGYHMRITAPISLLNFLKICADAGILVKDGQALETLAKVDCVLFDKTGTLTLEQPHVGAILTCNGYTERDILEMAAAAEHRQSHPIARSILEEATAQGIEIPELDEAAYEIGYGVKVRFRGQTVLVGSERFMSMQGVVIPSEIQAHEASCHLEGFSLVYVAIDCRLGGVLELKPTVRPEAKKVVLALRQLGLSLYIISGDQEQPTRQLAQTLGIDQVYAQVLPEDKARLVEELQAAGNTVCFVGDGINDAIALQKADVSISIRGASNIATDTAEIIFLDGTWNQLPKLLEISNALAANMKFNFYESLAPGLLCMSGAWLAGIGLSTSYILNFTFLNIGLANAMWPRIMHRISQASAEPDSELHGLLAAIPETEKSLLIEPRD